MLGISKGELGVNSKICWHGLHARQVGKAPVQAGTDSRHPDQSQESSYSPSGEPKNTPVLWIGWQTGQPDVNWGLAHPRSLRHTVQVKVEGLCFLLLATPAAEFVSKHARTGSTGDSYDAKIP